MRPVCERAVRAVLHAVAAGVRLVHTRARLVVTQVVASLRVAGRAVQVRASTTKSDCSEIGSRDDHSMSSNDFKSTCSRIKYPIKKKDNFLI